MIGRMRRSPRAPLTARSAIVALTHDPKLDDPALTAALRSPAFYIGALGSRQTHARRLDRLKATRFLGRRSGAHPRTDRT